MGEEANNFELGEVDSSEDLDLVKTNKEKDHGNL